MEIKYVDIKTLRPYPQNAKKHPDDQVDHIANSIQEFGFKQPLVIDRDNVVIIGHGRLLASKKLGITEVPCVVADDLTEEQIKALRLADNKTNESEWDLSYLDDELDTILDIDMSQFGFGSIDDDNDQGEIAHNTLADIFTVPPFSILDTRQGYWQDRKKAWKSLGIEGEIGRDAKAYTTEHMAEKYGRKSQNGTSIFDPVLCEIMYKWFCVEGGLIYDCFAGGSVRGIVAEKLGYKYKGIDIRQEQIDANYKNAKELGVAPTWYCDDSMNADKYLQDSSVDMIFSCPPYGDLEVYSDNPNDISNMEYADFCKAYKQIINIACSKLKENRFAVFVVGDIRDKKGCYRDFVDYTKQCFLENGLKTYNEAILIDMLGTAMLRANQTFKSRKLVKVHQNVLVFYKGDVSKIKAEYPNIAEMDNMEFAID